jgi:histone-lysine N-methyltransferase SETD3
VFAGLCAQVTISYGLKSSGELLLSYGFFPPPGSNPYDAAFLAFAPEITDPAMQEKRRALVARGILPMDYFGLLIDALPAGLLPHASFCTARPKNASPAAIKQLAVQHFDEGQLPDIDGVSSELIALEAVVKQCRAALPGYKQSSAADRQLAETSPQGGGFDKRAALVAAMRVRDAQILSRTDFVATQRIRELKKAAGRSRV